MCLVVSGIAISLNTLLVLEPKALATPPWLIALAIPVYFSAALSLSYWILDVNKPKKSLKIAFTITTLCYVLFA